jgi:hypothetical protein
VVMYLRRNYIRNGVESGVESGVECSETNIRKLRFGINFRDSGVPVRKLLPWRTSTLGHAFPDVRKLRFGINFQDACVSRRMRF